MAKFKCKSCGEINELDQYQMKVVAGEVVTEDAKCCLEYMKSIPPNKGLGGIIKKPNGTVSGKF